MSGLYSQLRGRAAQAQRYASIMKQTPDEKFELKLELSPQQALERIIKSSDDMEVKSDKEAWLSWISGDRGHGTFQHRLQGKSLYVQKRPIFQNSQHGLEIRFEPESFGCSLFAERSLNPWTRAFLRLWVGFVILIGGIGAMSLLYEMLKGHKPLSDLIWLLIPIGMMAFCCLWILFGRLLARKEISEIRAWLGNVFADVKAESEA